MLTIEKRGERQRSDQVHGNAQRRDAVEEEQEESRKRKK